MRELGRRSGESRRKPRPERVPASLREELRNLDPKVVRRAIEQTLAGGNESARVSAVKLLADVDAFSRDGGEERDFRARFRREMDAHGEEARRKIEKLVLNAVLSIVRGVEHESPRPPAWVVRLAENLDADTKARIAELKTEREALEAELAGVRLQREEFIP
jgi:hypothetical protein